MLFFFHLFIGLAAGAVLAVLFKNKWAILFTGLGGVICDLLDKPLGHIFLSSSINDGRIFIHTLLVFCICLVLGLILWKLNHKRIFFVCLSAGIILHQLGDEMWNVPRNWFWPLFGPFEDATYIWPAVPDWFIIIAQIAVWTAGILLGLYGAVVVRKLAVPRTNKPVRILLTVSAFAALLLAFRSVIWDVFLTGPWADYFGTMLQHELLTFSEYICGIGSVIILLLFINYPVVLSGNVQQHILAALGIFTFCAAVISAVLLLSGIQLDFGYGENTTALLLSITGLSAAGIVLFLLRGKISALTAFKS